MKMNTAISAGAFCTILSAAVSLAPVTSGAAAPFQRERQFHYCEGIGGRNDHNFYYSSAFGAIYNPAANSTLGIENSYRSYLEGQQNATIFSVTCLGPYSSMREAMDAENEAIASDRRRNKSIVMTHWSYSE